VGSRAWYAKGQDSPYSPRSARWVKIRRSDTTEATVLAVTGTARRPQAVLLRMDDGTELLSSPALTAPQARTLAEQLTGLLGPAQEHPEHGRLLPLTEPLLAEVRPGTGRHRTVVFIRLRAGE
jgi:bifunctional non-homologous end joining protein LigD